MATLDFIAAIELGSSKISGVAGRKSMDGSINIMAFATVKSSSFIDKGVIFNIDKAADSIVSLKKQLESQLKAQIAKVYVGIGGLSMRSVSNEIGRAVEGTDKISQELVDSINDENRTYPIEKTDILSVIPQEYKIDNILQVDPIGVTGRHITGRFLNIVASSVLKRNLELSFGQAQVEIADLLVAPEALAQVVLTEKEIQQGCLLVDFGAKTTTVSVYKNGILRFLSVLPLGSNNITRDITSLQMEEEEAEKLKSQYGSAILQVEQEVGGESSGAFTLDDGRTLEKKDLNDVIEARVTEILMNVKHQLELSGYENRLLSGAVLTGGGSNLKDLEDAFLKVMKDSIAKVRIANFINATVKGKADALNRNATLNSLLGILSQGKDNCCNVQKEAPETKGMFDDDANIKEQEEKKKIEKEEEKVEKPKKEKKPSKEKGPSRIGSFFGRLTDELFNDDNME